MTDVVTSVMRINSTAANTAAAIVDALDRIRPIGLAVARSFSLPATFGLRPPNTVTSAATPPVVMNDHVHLSESGPKITRPLINSHASATANSQPGRDPTTHDLDLRSSGWKSPRRPQLPKKTAP